MDGRLMMSTMGGEGFDCCLGLFHIENDKPSRVNGIIRDGGVFDS